MAAVDHADGNTELYSNQIEHTKIKPIWSLYILTAAVSK